MAFFGAVVFGCACFGRKQEADPIQHRAVRIMRGQRGARLPGWLPALIAEDLAHLSSKPGGRILSVAIGAQPQATQARGAPHQAEMNSTPDIAASSDRSSA